jgi:histidinol-phosphate aminotransferase
MGSADYSLTDLDAAWEDPSIARLMLNENPVRPSKKVVDAITEGARKANWYPGTAPKLREKIGKIYDVPADWVYLASGSSEVIDNMMRLFCQVGDEVILPVPTFSLYAIRAAVNGYKAVEIPLRAGDLQYDTDAVLKAVTDKTKLIVIINPASPTGMFIDPKDIRRVLDTGIPTCLDEAYLEYTPEAQSLVPLVKEYENAFVSHTMSKANGLAGMRFGYVLAQPAIIKALEKLALPWHISVMALAGAEAMLDDKESLREKVKHNNDWMEKYFNELKAIGLKPFRAHGNYMLVDASDFGYTSKEIFDMAFAQKVSMKTIPAIHGRSGYFRLTPGTDEENKRCLEVLKKIFSKKKGE